MKQWSVFINNFIGILKNYPTVIISSLVAAIVMIGVLNLESSSITLAPDIIEQKTYKLSKIVYLGVLGISLSFASAMLLQKNKKSPYLQLLMLLVLFLMYFLFPFHFENFTIKHTILLIILFILSHLIVAFAPFIGEQKEMKFWEYNKNLFVNIVLTGIFTGVLVGGIELAAVALQQLFNIEFIDQLIYPKIAVFFGIFGSVIIFLLFAKEGFSYLQKKQDYPSVLKFFVQFILIPLLFIYCTILLLYGLKILLQWELPNGWVSSLVIVYAFLGILALLLVYPLVESNSKSWVQWFSNVFYISLLPFTILLFVAIGRRISDYGFTEKRYFVLLIAIWLAITTLYFLLRRNAKIKFIPISLFVALLLSITLPVFNVHAGSLNSQENLFYKNLQEFNLLNKHNEINYSTPITRKNLSQLQSQIQFFQDRKQLDRLEELTGIAGSNKPHFSASKIFSDSFNTIIENSTVKNNFATIINIPRPEVVRVKGYHFFIQFNSHIKKTSIPNNNESILYNRESHTVELVDENDIVKDKYSLKPWFQSLEKIVLDSANVERPKHQFDIGQWHCELQLSNLSRHKNKVDSVEYNFLGELLFMPNE